MTRQHDEQGTGEGMVELFVQACGLRKAELKRLRVRNFSRAHHDFWCENHWIHVDACEDIPAHEVPFELNSEWIIAKICQGRASDDLVFAELPDMDYERLREEYTEHLFLRYDESLGPTGAPHCMYELGQHLKQALGLSCRK